MFNKIVKIGLLFALVACAPKADMKKAGDEDVFKKVKEDFNNSAISIDDSEIKNQMSLALERAKKDFK